MDHLTSHELQSRLQSPEPPVLLHVLPEEVFRAKRIPSSQNACVYEMAFLDNVAKLGVSKDQEIVVYGAGQGSHDFQAAREKLVSAGYQRIADYPGGIADWERGGLPVEGEGGLPVPPVPHGRFVIDTEASVIRWTGRNLFNSHNGTVRLKSGELVLDHGKLISGQLTVDMSTIACEDLADPGWNAMLIRHLRDADFFDVAHYPTAEFAARSVTPLPNATAGTPGHLLRGDITVRGVIRPLELPVVLASADGHRITGQGQFELDRTEFGSVYGSGKFFQFLGKHLVNDHVHLHLKVHADQAREVES